MREGLIREEMTMKAMASLVEASLGAGRGTLMMQAASISHLDSNLDSHQGSEAARRME